MANSVNIEKYLNALIALNWSESKILKIVRLDRCPENSSALTPPPPPDFDNFNGM